MSKTISHRTISRNKSMETERYFEPKKRSLTPQLVEAKHRSRHAGLHRVRFNAAMTDR
jgi:hypothetical protein